MLLGVPKEIKESEKRIAMTPYAVDQVIRAGHKVIIETNAGTGSNFTDKMYESVGAKIVKTADIAWGADLVVKVKEPIESEYKYFTKDKLLFYISSSCVIKETDRSFNVIRNNCHCI